MSTLENIIAIVEKTSLVESAELLPLLAKLKKEVGELIERDEWLSKLEAAGVDNWGGYDFARTL